MNDAPPREIDVVGALDNVVVAAARTPGFLELERGRRGPPAFGSKP